MSTGAALALLIIYVPAIVLGAVIGDERKGRGVLGLLLGLLLCWLGVLVIACIPPTHAKRVQRERARLQVQREARAG